MNSYRDVLLFLLAEATFDVAQKCQASARAGTNQAAACAAACAVPPLAIDSPPEVLEAWNRTGTEHLAALHAWDRAGREARDALAAANWLRGKLGLPPVEVEGAKP